VFRGESALQLARDGEVEGVPEATGWTPSSAPRAAGVGQGLVEGTPTRRSRPAAARSGSLTLLRFVPIEGPPVVVDVAAYTIATSREGRALIRAHYEVRNERAASLRIRPPPGFEILGVRVAGETAVIARDREGAWRVPLQRSVDTVSGLLSFPVEVALLGEAKPWAQTRAARTAAAAPRRAGGGDAGDRAPAARLSLAPAPRRRRGGRAFTRARASPTGSASARSGRARPTRCSRARSSAGSANDFEGRPGRARPAQGRWARATRTSPACRATST
jgi:hypothetical protein